MSLRVGLLLLAAGCAACFSDPPAPQRVSSESGSSTGGIEGTDSSSSEDSSSGEDSSGTTTPASSSSGEPALGCDDAFDAESCSAASDKEFEECSWYPTISHDVLSCDPWATGGGACVIEQGLDACRGSEPTCPSGASWYYQVTDGLVEIVDATNLCYGLSEFTPCPSPRDDPAETDSTSVGTSASTDGESGTSGGAETGASASSVGDSGDGGTSGGTTGDGRTLQEEIEAVCACACDE